ncbi:hypothetical protein HYS99_01150 [Candidatus Giovannonibacteria bacterium]|nr:hypothetical protein [Candidatus Giovannonibacteria bacterium]
MLEIIPSINVSDFTEAKKRIKQVERYVSWVHLDVSDGVFTKHISWHDPKDLVDFKSKPNIEVHLMIDSPEKMIDAWLATAAKRLIFHQEATREHDLIINKIHDLQKEVGIAIKPDTNWLKIFPYLDKVELVQFLAVNPGPSGQEFDEQILHKIGHVRSLSPRCMIEVDGGVNKAVAERSIKEGANLLVAGNAIFGSKNINRAIKELKNE